MGKASKWFRALLGSKNSPDSGTKDKKKSGSSKKSRSPYRELDANNHAIAVAAATAVGAEAALAAAQAAAEVVRLTNSGTLESGTRSSSSTAVLTSRDRLQGVRIKYYLIIYFFILTWELAAIRIQSAFRAYLAKRALRALRGLVKLQAIVRGRIVRKQSADMLRRMQALARIQARACSNRAALEPSHRLMNPSQHRPTGSPSHGRHESPQRLELKRRMAKPNTNSSVKLDGLHLAPSWLDRWMEESARNRSNGASISPVSRVEERSVKMIEIDSYKPTHNQRHRDRNVRGVQIHLTVATFDPLSGRATRLEKTPSMSSGDAPSLRSLRFPSQDEQVLAWTAENSPYLHSPASIPSGSRGGPFTPTRSECTFGDYMSHPGYMASTESFLAKVRSQSAPRQRMQHDGANRSSVTGLWDQDSLSERGSATPSNVRNRAYRSSGLNRVGTPIRYPGQC